MSPWCHAAMVRPFSHNMIMHQTEHTCLLSLTNAAHSSDSNTHSRQRQLIGVESAFSTLGSSFNEPHSDHRKIILCVESMHCMQPLRSIVTTNLTPRVPPGKYDRV